MIKNKANQGIASSFSPKTKIKTIFTSNHKNPTSVALLRRGDETI